MINTYGYMVLKNNPNNLPLHVVQISSNLLSGYSVFNSAKDANKYIAKMKDELKIKYDSDFKFSENLTKCYQNGKQLFSKRENHEIYIAA